MEGLFIAWRPTVARPETAVVNVGTSAELPWPTHSGHVVLLSTHTSDLKAWVSCQCANMMIRQSCNVRMLGLQSQFINSWAECGFSCPLWGLHPLSWCLGVYTMLVWRLFTLCCDMVLIVVDNIIYLLLLTTMLYSLGVFALTGSTLLYVLFWSVPLSLKHYCCSV